MSSEAIESICGVDGVTGEFTGNIFPLTDWEVDLGDAKRMPLYLCLLLWTFMGVAIGADVFMSAIEVITSKTTSESIGGRTIYAQIWNPTVANLTLMALGSSAPEILLSVIEIYSGRFYSGALGPSTIVGSAAFNLMVISGICVSALPKGEGRFIKDVNVRHRIHILHELPDPLSTNRSSISQQVSRSSHTSG